jgi:hypothetical protein
MDYIKINISTLGFPLFSLGCWTLNIDAVPLPEALENIFPEVQDNNCLNTQTSFYSCLFFGTGPAFRAPERRSRVYHHLPHYLYSSSYWFNKCGGVTIFLGEFYIKVNSFRHRLYYKRCPVYGSLH